MLKSFKQKNWVSIVLMLCIFTIVLQSSIVVASEDENNEVKKIETLQNKINFLENQKKYSEIENRLENHFKATESELKILQEKVDLGWKSLNARADWLDGLIGLISIILAVVGFFGFSWIYIKAKRELEDMEKIKNEIVKIYDDINSLYKNADYKLNEMKRRWELQLKNADLDLKFSPELKSFIKQEAKQILSKKEKGIIDLYSLGLNDYEEKSYDNTLKYWKQTVDLIEQKESQQKYAWIFSNYALFLTEIRKDYNEAEKYYKKALEFDLKDANTTGNYGIFLQDIRKDYDKAEKYYKKALELDSENANATGNYGIFLKSIRKDYDKAEKYYKKALELDSEKGVFWANYAIFLTDIRKDYNKAEKYYKKALELDSEDVNTISNYAKLLFIQNKDDKAEEYWQKAFQNYNKKSQKPILLELYFYHYAHSKNTDIRQESKEQIKKILEKGITSPGWNLDENIRKAEREKHPEIEIIKEFAKRISRI